MRFRRCIVLLTLFWLTLTPSRAEEFEIPLLEFDEQELKAICAELQRGLQGEYILDVAALRDLAHTVLPLLEADPKTRPYAAWLRTRLDYLDVAAELRLRVPPPTTPKVPPAVQPYQPSAVVVRKEWLQRIKTEPAGPRVKTLVDRLKPIFREQQVPPALVWLAEVESSFDSRAESPSGAVGLFQLMPATARSLGLKTFPFDQRTDPDLSARAAATYLRQLYGRFGDWPLAIAAYNAGPTRVASLLERHRAKTFDEIATRLPAETQLYVPRIDAVIFRREGLTLAELVMNPPTSRSETKDPH